MMMNCTLLWCMFPPICVVKLSRDYWLVMMMWYVSSKRRDSLEFLLFFVHRETINTWKWWIFYWLLYISFSGWWFFVYLKVASSLSFNAMDIFYKGLEGNRVYFWWLMWARWDILLLYIGTFYTISTTLFPRY